MAMTHEEEMELIKNQLYIPVSTQKQPILEDEVSTQTAAPEIITEKPFHKRRKKILDSLNSKEEAQVIDLEELYFSTPTAKK